MLVLVISDTHGQHEHLQEVLDRVKPDVIYHAGDAQGWEGRIQVMAGCPLFAVRGNCDFNVELPSDRVLELGEHRVFLTHGHLYDVRYHNHRLTEVAKRNGCDIAIYGHTHCPENIVEDGIRVINPGSLSQPRQEGRRPSYAVLYLDEQGEVTSNIVYL